MNVQEYTGVLAEIIEAMQDRGDPSKIRRVQVTEEEMKEITQSGAFRRTVAKYYGGTDVPTFTDIVAGSDGKIISLYMLDTLICLGPWTPTGALADVTYPVLEEETRGITTFVTDGPTPYMLVGQGNPVDDFVLGSNANIELGLAVRKRNDPTYYGDGAGGFDIELEPDETWTFALTAGSKNPDVPIFTEMYDVSLYIDIDPTGSTDPIKWDLQYTDNLKGGGKNYVWFNRGIRVVGDSATNADHSVTQMIQQYAFSFINNAIPASVPRTKKGVPLGMYSIKLEARPRLTNDDPVFVELVANVTEA